LSKEAADTKQIVVETPEKLPAPNLVKSGTTAMAKRMEVSIGVVEKNVIFHAKGSLPGEPAIYWEQE